MTDKYPRTPHLPFSPGKSEDDIDVAGYDTLFLRSGDVVVTEKLDGGNCCLKDGLVFARTHSKPASHASFSQVKQLYQSCILPMMDAEFGDGASENYELFGENMEAVHSIDYTPELPSTSTTSGGGDGAAERHALPSCFYLFAVYDRSKQIYLDFDLVREFAFILNIPVAPVLWRGPIRNFPGVKLATTSSEVGEVEKQQPRFASVSEFDAALEKQIKTWMEMGSTIGPQKKVPEGSTSATQAWKSDVPMEGVVIRTVDEIPPASFESHIAKFVRKGHIQTDDTFKWSWKHANISQQ